MIIVAEKLVALWFYRVRVIAKPIPRKGYRLMTSTTNSTDTTSLRKPSMRGLRMSSLLDPFVQDQTVVPLRARYKCSWEGFQSSGYIYDGCVPKEVREAEVSGAMRLLRHELETCHRYADPMSTKRKSREW